MPEDQRESLQALMDVSGCEQGVFLGWSQKGGYKVLCVGSNADNLSNAKLCADNLLPRIGIQDEARVLI